MEEREQRVDGGVERHSEFVFGAAWERSLRAAEEESSEIECNDN